MVNTSRQFHNSDNYAQGCGGTVLRLLRWLVQWPTVTDCCGDRLWWVVVMRGKRLSPTKPPKTQVWDPKNTKCIKFAGKKPKKYLKKQIQTPKRYLVAPSQIQYWSISPKIKAYIVINQSCHCHKGNCEINQASERLTRTTV